MGALEPPFSFTLRSMIKTVMIVGGSGFVGYHLAKRLREDYKVFASYHRNPIHIPGVTYVPLEVGERNQIKRFVYIARPDVLIYVAGSNQMEWAEKNPQRSDRVHQMGVAAIANATDILQPRFIYLSNSFVYDGFRGNYHEADTVLPGTAIGRSKAGGENIVRARCLNYLIVRSAPVLGRGTGHSLSMSDKWRLLLDRGKPIEIPFQQLHTFSHVYHLTDFVASLLESNFKNRTIHFGGHTKLGMLQLAQLFARQFGHPSNLVRLKRNFNKKGVEIKDAFTFDFSLNVSLAVEQFKLKPLGAEDLITLLNEEHHSSSPFS
jgi:dTDP-4-dehydrorhamnose reductase